MFYNLIFLLKFCSLKRNLINPGDIRSRNNFPRAVQKSPASNIATIEEEDDEEHVSKLLVSQISSLKPISKCISFCLQE